MANRDRCPHQAPGERLVYLDNAATSHPKPAGVYTATAAALAAGGSPGRGGHRLALAAGRRVLAARATVADLLGVTDSARLLFTGSATDALNAALFGLLQPGDHCVTTAAEHNALRRPLLALAERGVETTWLPVAPDGGLDPGTVAAALRRHTRLIAVAHGNNVTGALQPVADLGAIARTAGVFLLVDAAQTAGTVPIDVADLGVHLLAAAGHKGLLGPQGTGILYVHPDVDLRPVRLGGTGTMARAAFQPSVFPEGFESGTLNVPGIAGLAAGAEFLAGVGIAAMRERELAAVSTLTAALRAVPGVDVYGPVEPHRRCGLVSFNIRGLDPAEVEERLDAEFGIIARAGLHCNPGAHGLLGTLPGGGAVRLSPGYFNTPADIDAATAAVATLAAGAGH